MCRATELAARSACTASNNSRVRIGSDKFPVGADPSFSVINAYDAAIQWASCRNRALSLACFRNVLSRISNDQSQPLPLLCSFILAATVFEAAGDLFQLAIA
jgi:hypothetical protein